MLVERVSVIKQKLFQDNIFLREILMRGVYYFALILMRIGSKKASLKLLMQVHRTSRSDNLKDIIANSYIVKYLSLCSDRKSQRVSNFNRFFGTRIVVLKDKVSDTEKGVVIVKFTYVIECMPSFVDINKLLEDYELVLEPSWSGYCGADILQYTKFNQRIFIMAPERSDFKFIQQLKSNLWPLALGPGDWVDGETIAGKVTNNKKYDLVMNANWGSWKRHYVLFEALTKLSPNLKVALIGVQWGGQTKNDIVKLAKYYGIENQIDVYDRIPYDDVVKVMCEAKVGVLLSLKEGANKAISESIMCNLPIIIVDSHVGGARNKVNSSTGVFTSEDNLAGSIESMLNNLEKYSTRLWGMENIDCRVSSAVLNAEIKSFTQSEWSTDLAIKKNDPEVSYVNMVDKDRFHMANNSLKEYVF